MSKVFNTRLQLKYDLWKNWSDNNPVLLAGEIAIVNIPAETGADGIVHEPAILFKVGDGATTFDKLPWASGLAADVYEWAKREKGLASEIIYKPEVKDETGDVVTDAIYVNTAISSLESAVEALEGIFSEEGEDGTVTGISDIIKNYINTYLNKADSAQTGKYVSAVSQSNGVITVERADLPTYTLDTGDTNGTVKFNNTDVAVKGLGSAAYAATTDFDAAGTGASKAAEVLGTEGDAATAATVYGAKAAAAAAQKTADDAATAVSNLDKKVGAIPEGATATTVTAYAKEVADAATEVANAKVASVTAADASITIDGEDTTTPTVKVNISADADNDLTLADDGLKVVIPTAAEYEIKKETTAEEGYAATYKLFKNGAQAGASINIPKDMVVSSGSVVELAEGEVEDLSAGTYIKLVLANANNETLYIPVGSLIEYVTSGSQTGDMIVIAINDNHEVTATITNGTITKAKLEESVQTSLGKADSAVQKIETGTENGTIKVDNTDVAVAGLGTAAYADTEDFAAADILNSLKGSATATAEADGKVSVLTGITQADGVISKTGEVTLEKVAKTGKLGDLVEDVTATAETTDYVVFYCGTSEILTK